MSNALDTYANCQCIPPPPPHASTSSGLYASYRRLPPLERLPMDIQVQLKLRQVFFGPNENLWAMGSYIKLKL